MGLLLTFIALVLFVLVAIPLLVLGTIITLFTHKGDRYYKNIAKGIDIFGNVLGAPLFNLILIKKNGYQFGNFGETISSVLGKNERDGTLLIVGLVISKVLNFIDKDHCKNSIK